MNSEIYRVANTRMIYCLFLGTSCGKKFRFKGMFPAIEWNNEYWHDSQSISELVFDYSPDAVGHNYVAGLSSADKFPVMIYDFAIYFELGRK